MLVQSDYRISRAEFDSLIHHRPGKFIEDQVKLSIADNLAHKLTPFIPIEKEEGFDEIIFRGKMIMIGSEDFIKIRGLLNRLKQDPHFPRVLLYTLEQIDTTLYAEFNNFPADQVLPQTDL